MRREPHYWLVIEETSFLSSLGRQRGQSHYAALIGTREVNDPAAVNLTQVILHGTRLPLELQAKLLRVLQEEEFERVGGSETRKVNVRILAATNHDLASRVKEGRFRADLFYRLNVFPITLPPLRHRKKDLPLLIQHFVRTYAEKYGKRIGTIPARDQSGIGV